MKMKKVFMVVLMLGLMVYGLWKVRSSIEGFVVVKQLWNPLRRGVGVRVSESFERFSGRVSNYLRRL